MPSLTERLALIRPLVIPDVETTSTPDGKTYIVQIGMRVHKPGEVVKEWKTLVRPPVPISPETTAIHGITDAMVNNCRTCGGGVGSFDHVEQPIDGVGNPLGQFHVFKPWPTFGDIAQNLAFGFTGADFAGYNIPYDLRVFKEEFARHGIDFNYSGAAVICSFRLWQVLEPRTLSDAMRRWVGEELEGAHDAMNDVIGTEKVLLGQLTAGEGKLPMTVAELGVICFPPKPRESNWIDSEGKFAFINGVACINFSKNKGMPLKAAKGFLAWILKQDFSPEVKDIAQKAINGQYPTQQQELKPAE